MKIALQLSGLPNNFKTASYFLQHNLLDHISKNNEIDVYITIWDNVYYNDYISFFKDYPTQALILNYNEIINDNEFNSLLDFCKSKHVWVTGEHVIKHRSTLLQFYQRYLCNVARQQNNDYNLCIIARPDIIYLEPLLNEYLIQFTNHICIPTGSDWCQGINDMLAIGNPDLIDIYCDTYNYIRDLVIQNNTYYHPEHILKLQLDKNKVPIRRFSFPLLLRHWRLNF